MEKTKEQKSMTMEEQVQEWKDKYKNVFVYEVETEDGKIKRVLKNCLLDEDKSILDDDSLFFGLSQKVDELVNAKVGELKKL